MRPAELITIAAAAFTKSTGFADHAQQAEWASKQSTTAACACLLTPSQMEGPFYLDYALRRSNLTEDRAGMPVHLHLRVMDVSSESCTPLEGAWVDIWGADAMGVYSGYGEEAEEDVHGKLHHMVHRGGRGGHKKRDWNDVQVPLLGAGEAANPLPPPGRPGKGGKWPPPPPGGPPGGGDGPEWHVPSENNATFLRGVQRTSAAGEATFVTVYPGWYPGRTNHIHLKVHAPLWDSDGSNPGLAGGHNTTHAHTTQLYFPDAANDKIALVAPYADNSVRRTPNARDGLYRQMKGFNVLDVSYVGDVDGGEGYVSARIDLGVDRWW